MSSVRHLRDTREERAGNITASDLIGILIEEICPSIYNKAVADILKRMQMQISGLDIDVHEEEYEHLQKIERNKKESKLE